jgi:hypothetical protein
LAETQAGSGTSPAAAADADRGTAAQGGAEPTNEVGKRGGNGRIVLYFSAE